MLLFLLIIGGVRNQELLPKLPELPVVQVESPVPESPPSDLPSPDLPPSDVPPPDLLKCQSTLQNGFQNGSELCGFLDKSQPASICWIQYGVYFLNFFLLKLED